MSDETRWDKLRQIVREEVEAALSKFTKNGKPKIELLNGKWIGITEEQKEAWGAAYGALDLDAELKKAAAWCVSNPHLAPKSQIGRFLNTWLAKGQNAASLRSIPVERKTETPRKMCDYCGASSVGSINGRHPCEEHWKDAMDGVRPMGAIKRIG